MIKGNILINITVFCFAVMIHISYSFGQDLEKEFNEFKSGITNDFEKTKSENTKEFQNFTDSINLDFYNFIQQSDKEFGNLLKNNWTEYKLHSRNFPDNHLKPQIPGQYTNRQKASESVISINHGKKITPHVSNPLLNSYLSIKGNDNFTSDTIRVNFFGIQAGIPIDKATQEIPLSGMNNNGIAGYWLGTSKTQYVATLLCLKKIKENYNLNDWAYLKLLSKFCQQIYSNDKNRGNLLFWFLGKKSGYDLKIGLNNHFTYILFSSLEPLYEKPGFELKGRTYYVFEGDPLSVSTYSDKIFEGQSVSLEFDMPLLFPSLPVSRKAEINFSGKQYPLTLISNKNFIDFYKDYPLTNLSVYFQSYLSEDSRESLINQISPILAKMSKTGAVTFLYSMAQQITTYQTDKEQFGREKYFFPEESLFYNASDCEDRALILSFLLKEFTNTETLALNYTGHVLSGIPVSDSSLSGSKIEYKGKSYIMADPSYIDAPLGIISPGLEDKTPKVIELQCNIKGFNLDRGNTNLLIEDTKRLTNNKLVFCGYLIDTASVNHNNQLVVGTINHGGVSVKLTSKSTGNSGGHKIEVDSMGNILVLGSFQKKLAIDTICVTTGSPDLFLMKADTNFRLKWLTPLFVHRDTASGDYFNAVVKSDGNLICSNNIDLVNNVSDFSINTDGFGNYAVAGYLSQQYKLTSDTITYETGAEFDVVDWLVQENKRLVKSSYNPQITPLLAILNYIVRSDRVLDGKEISSSLKTITQGQAIGKNYFGQINNIESIKKMQDFILMKTCDSKLLEIQKFIFADNARLKFYIEPENIRLFVYSGVKVKESDSGYKINYFLINKYTASFVYDYDQHYRKTIPARQISN